jgi:hypothetical protein
MNQTGTIMKIIKMIIACTLTLHCAMPAMLKHVLPEITWSIVPNPTAEAHLKYYGTDDASPIMQERLKEVEAEYREKGLIIPENIELKQLKPLAIEELKQMGSNTPNVVNNGIDTLHTTCDHKELAEKESKQLLAHELAHIVLGKYTWINPHWYMNQCTKTSTLIMTSITGASLLWHACKTDKALLACLAGAMTSSYLLNAMKWRNHSKKCLRPLANSNELGIYYPHLGKLEEIECDVIAACVMPKGGKHGAALWQKKLDMYGDRNGTHGSHPYYSTRVKYHRAIQWLQEKGEEE